MGLPGKERSKWVHPSRRLRDRRSDRNDCAAEKLQSPMLPVGTVPRRKQPRPLTESHCKKIGKEEGEKESKRQRKNAEN